MDKKKLVELFRKRLFIISLISLLLSIIFLFIFNDQFFFASFLLIFAFFSIYSIIAINRKLRNFVGIKLIIIVTLFVSFLFFLLFFSLLNGSLYILSNYSIIELLFSSDWRPTLGNFGLFAVIIDTLIVTIISMLIAVPISLLCAIYISEYAPKKFRSGFRPFIDVLAGVPSVVYGLCALIVFVPLVRDIIAPFFGINDSSGFCLFTASLILSIMVFPIIISLCIESFSAIPISLKEASLSLGATKWETVKKVFFRQSGAGILSAILLGFGRAFGETIAVSMVVGNQALIPSSLFGPGQTLASMIALYYVDVRTNPLIESAIIFVALILFIVVLIFNYIGYLILKRASRR